MSEEKMVETISGKVAPVSKCRKFGTGWYLVGDQNIENSGDCQEIDGRFYRIEVGQIIFDHGLKKYVLKNDNLYHGIVGIDDESVLSYGAFTPNETINGIVVLENKSHVRVLDAEIFKGSRLYRERLSDGKFYHINVIPAAEFFKISPPKAEYKISLPYNASQVLDENIRKYQNLEVNILPNVKEYAPFFKDLTFGLEFETIAGTLPQKVLNNTGLIPLRDGSIQGIEYVTVPMSGAKGFQTTLNAVQELNYRTRCDETCALHMHIGNVPRTPEFILAFFKITCAIQDELYTLFPLYKKYNFGVKSKNYTKPFPVAQLLAQMNPVIDGSNIKHNFNILYQYLSMGESFYDRDCDLKNVQSHPADREDRAKWHISTRYYLHNLIPLIFGNKQTIEFRIHTATSDINKVSYFMLLNAAIVNYAIDNTAKILKDPQFITYNNFGINDIIQSQATTIFTNRRVSDRFLESFYNYINIRKKGTESQNREGNIRGNEDAIPTPTRINWLKKEVVAKITDSNPKLQDLQEKYDRALMKLENDHSDQILTSHRYQQLKNDLVASYLKLRDQYEQEEVKEATPW